MHIVVNEIGLVMGGFMGFVYVPAMVLGIGAWGILAGVIVTEAIERNYRA